MPINTKQNIEQTLFSEKQWKKIVDLVGNLNSNQSLWLGQQLTTMAAGDSSNEQSQAKTQRIVIAYGTETGNSKGVAQRFASLASEKSIAVEVKSLADIKVRQLASIDLLFIVCSTHGDGDPPEPIELFYNALLNHQASLDKMAFSVLALGDSTYDLFCETGKIIDKNLNRLKAQRLIACKECDVDFENEAQEWVNQCLALISAKTSSDVAEDSAADKVDLNVFPKENPLQSEFLESLTLTAPSYINSNYSLEQSLNEARSWIEKCLTFTADKKSADMTVSAADSPAFSKANPLQVELLENTALTAPSRASAIHHLELALNPDDNLKLNPGDSIGIFPNNPLELVQSVLALCNFSGYESITLKEQAMSLIKALSEHTDLTVVSSKFIESWATLSQHEELLTLIEDKDKVRKFLKSHQLTHILKRYPLTIEAQQFVSLLRPLQPRLYDVANSQRVAEGEIHLTVELYQYDFENKSTNGVASEFLLELKEGDTLTIFPSHNKRFQLPTEPKVPIIMIAAGPGIAPYRAFVQEITDNAELQHPTWLLLSEHTFTDDFLYQVEWQKALETGNLTRLDTLFHSDMPSISLLDIITKNIDTFKEWLDAGAHLYLSGHKPELDKLEKSLKTAFDANEDTRQKWADITSQNRFHRNLY